MGPDDGRIRDEQIVADHLDPTGDRLREQGDAGGGVLGERVLDRNDREPFAPLDERRAHRVRVERTAVASQVVVAAVPELRRRDVEGDAHLCGGVVTGPFDGRAEQRKCTFVALELRPPAAFVGDAATTTLLMQEGTGGDVDLGCPLQCLGHARGARSNDEQVLDVEAAIGMGTAAEDLDLGEWQSGDRAPTVGEVPPKRCSACCGAQPCIGHRGGDGHVRTDRGPMLVRLELAEAGIKRGLIIDRQSPDGRHQQRRRMVDHLTHVEATDARTTVPSFRRLAAARARAGRRDGTSAHIAGT